MKCILLIYVIFGFQITFASTYYISPTGDDANLGTISSPFKTINYGVGQLVAGDKLYVRGGVYNESVTVSALGTAVNPITISAYAGEFPVIDGGATLPTTWGALMNVTGAYIYISGFEIKNSNYPKRTGIDGGEGLRFDGGHHNSARFMKISYCGEHGIIAQADDITIEDCDVSLCAMSNSVPGASSGWANGIAFAREATNGITDNGIIRRCKVYNNYGEGIVAFEAIHITIEDCEIFNNWTQNLYISDASYVLA